MNKEQLLALLDREFQGNLAGQSMLQRMEKRYSKDPDLDANSACYWIAESLFSTLGWYKRHVREGEMTAADKEKKDIAVLETAWNLLYPYTKHAASKQGSI